MNKKNANKLNYYCLFCTCVTCFEAGSGERVFRPRGVVPSGRIALARLNVVVSSVGKVWVAPNMAILGRCHPS